MARPRVASRGGRRPAWASTRQKIAEKVPKRGLRPFCPARLDDHGAFSQAIGEGDFDLPRHKQGGLQGRFGREPLVNPPDAAAENTEYHNDRADEDGHLLLAQTHGGR
jgi:hypothetical protein